MMKNEEGPMTLDDTEDAEAFAELFALIPETVRIYDLPDGPISCCAKGFTGTSRGIIHSMHIEVTVS